MKAHPVIFIALPLLLRTPTFVLRSLIESSALDANVLSLAGEAADVVGFAIGALVASTMLHAVRMVGAGTPPTMASALRAGFSTWGSVVIATITTSIALLVSFICFIVPGIIRTSRYALVLPAVADGLSGKEARARSSSLVKENGTSTMLLWLFVLGVSWSGVPLMTNVALGVVGALMPGVGVATVASVLGDGLLSIVTVGSTLFTAIVYGEFSEKSELSPVGLELVDSSGRHVAAPRTTGTGTLAAVAIVGALGLMAALLMVVLMKSAVDNTEETRAFLEAHPALGELLAHRRRM